MILFVAFNLVGCVFSYDQGAEYDIVLENVNIVPMNKEVVIKDHKVTISKGVITSIVPSNISTNSARSIDCKGAYLLPGLADMHMHLESINRENWPHAHPELYISHGVTTVRDLHGQPFINAMRDSINAKKAIGPTIIAYPPIIRGYEEDFLGLIDKYSHDGYQGVKLYGYFNSDDFKSAMQRAKELNLNTIGHIPFNVGLDGVISENINEIAHIVEIAWEFADLNITDSMDVMGWFQTIFDNFDKKYGSLSSDELKKTIDEEAASVVSKLANKGISVHTSIIVEKLVHHKVNIPDDFFQRSLNAYLPVSFFSNFVLGNDKHQLMYKNREQAAQYTYMICEAILRELKRQNITVIMGTDAGSQSLAVIPGASVYEELQILTSNGFSPYEALLTATRNAGILNEQITGENEFGTIEVGKRADFVLVSRNPLESVDLIDDINGVMVRGEWYPKEMLDEMIQIEDDAVQLNTDFWKAAANCVNDGEIKELFDMLENETNPILLESGYNALLKHYLSEKDYDHLPDAFIRASNFTHDTIRRVQLLNGYAWFIYENKWKAQYSTGIKAAKEATELYGTFGGLYDTLAWLYYENNQIDDAIEAMKKAIELSPNRAVYMDNLKEMERTK